MSAVRLYFSDPRGKNAFQTHKPIVTNDFSCTEMLCIRCIFFSKDVNDALFFAYRYTFQFSHFKIGYGDPLGSQAQYIH